MEDTVDELDTVVICLDGWMGNIHKVQWVKFVTPKEYKVFKKFKPCPINMVMQLLWAGKG